MTPDTDTDTPEAGVAEFAATIRAAFGDHAVEEHNQSGGYRWTWSRRGLWHITAGAVLHPEPVLTGPAGEWRIARANRAGAVYAMLVLAGADALPDGVDIPPRGSGLYAGGNGAGAVPIPVTGVPIVLRPSGDRGGQLQPVRAPGGSPAVVNLFSGCTFVCALDAGRMGVVVVKPMPNLPVGADVPAMLYPAMPESEMTRPRPPHRQPGANTGRIRGPFGGTANTYGRDDTDTPPAGAEPVDSGGPAGDPPPEPVGGTSTG